MRETLQKKWTEIRDSAKGAPERTRASLNMARTTGLMWELNRRGLVALVRVQISGSQNPSQIYRIHAANTPDKPAIIGGARSFTFAELDRRVDRLAHGLRARGFGRGQSVILMLHNSIELVEMSLAAARMGARAVAISWRSTSAELSYLANHSGASALLTDPELVPVVRGAEISDALRRNVFVRGPGVDGAVAVDSLYDARTTPFVAEAGSEDDAAVVIYTSGPTGRPKGAVRKFPKDTLPAAFRFIGSTPMRCDDVHLVTCPLYHSTAFGFLTLSHILGCTVVLMDEFKPRTFLELVARHRVTSTAVVPTMLHRVLALGDDELRGFDARSLRLVFAGGAPLPGPLAIEFMDRFGDILFNFYGATETGLVTLATPDDLRAAPGTIGRPLPGNDIRLLDDEGRPTTGTGELFVKNNFLVAGYHNDEGATRDSMRDGYFSVGDLARRDHGGRYFIDGRKRDMIISGGTNVYPAEVEGVLEAHPELAEVAVVGVPDPEWGERVRAFVVRRPPSQIDEGTLKLWTKERLAGPKVPRDFVFLDALPRNPTGKVLKRDLRLA